MKRILLVRHGETSWNSLRRLQGQADIALSDKGRDQALRLAPLVQSFSPDFVLTSDLQRARQTAALLGYPDAGPEPRLREQDLGAWTGQDIAMLLETCPQAYHDWRAGRFAPERGETWALFCARIQTVLLQAAETARQTALLVCHGGVIRAALDTALGLPPSRIIPVGPSSLTVLAYTETGPRLEAFNVQDKTIEVDAPD